MKIIRLATILLSISLVSANAQDVSLFDSDGEARAYINFDKDGTIFLWNGTPAAFLKNYYQDIHVIGFNGKFLGWYVNGIIYDRNGDIVGIRKGALTMNLKTESIKGTERIMPTRPTSPNAPFKPTFSSNWSSTYLAELLFMGKK